MGRITVEGDWMTRATPDPVPCRSCGQPMVWFRTVVHNKPIPLDAGFKVVSSMNDAGHKLTVIIGTTHFATCPNAAQHRKPRPTTAAQRSKRKRPGALF